MGRIKTSFIKHVSKDFLEKNSDKFSDDFGKNKEALEQLVSFESKRMRNSVAGYITSLKKQELIKR
jgi:small subunit ribosomal protein S17e